MARNKVKKPDDDGFPIGNSEPVTLEDEINATDLDELMAIDQEPEQSILIKPTIGRMVLYSDGFSDQLCAAQIAYVHDDYHINIGYIDRNGLPQSAQNIYLIQSAGLAISVGDCKWMDYQVEQAK